MSHISCPLCGLNAPRSQFWSNLSDEIEDIEAVSFRGLGRGRGFEIDERASVLDDEELCEAVAARCRAILKLLKEDEEDGADEGE